MQKVRENHPTLEILHEYHFFELHIPNPTGTTGHNEIKKERGRPRKNHTIKGSSLIAAGYGQSF